MALGLSAPKVAEGIRLICLASWLPVLIGAWGFQGQGLGSELAASPKIGFVSSFNPLASNAWVPGLKPPAMDSRICPGWNRACLGAGIGSARASGVGLRLKGLRMNGVQSGEDSSQAESSIRYISIQEAKDIDAQLMSEDGGWPLSSLMELAGLSAAEAIFDKYPPDSLAGKEVMVVCGKGNNGGDGLVIAKYLQQWGYRVSVIYPERKNQEPFAGLVKQLKALDVSVMMGLPGRADPFGLVVDAVFGFSYRAPVRPPFDFLIRQLKDPAGFGSLPVVSIDVPAGWDVENGKPKDESYCLDPEMLVSLTAPKPFARAYSGVHYLAGRFIPSRMQFNFKLQLPEFPGTKNFVELPPAAPLSEEAATKMKDLATEAAEVAEKEIPDIGPPLEEEEEVENPGYGPLNWPDPDDQIQAALDDAVQETLRIVGEKRQGWDQTVRSFVTSRLVSVGWTSSYPPDKTTAAKACFVAAKALQEKQYTALDILSEAKALAEGAFEFEGDLAAGKVLKAIAKLYGDAGEVETEEFILQDIDRIVKEKGYPEDLTPPPQRPSYTFADKWTIRIVSPEDMGSEEIEVVVRPKQKSRVLLKGWLSAMGFPEDDAGRYQFVVPASSKTWKDGVVELDRELGATGLVDEGKLLVERISMT